MTTAAWSTVLDHSSDAAFRAWGSELSTKLAAVGMVQTSDTGQINWSTVVRGAGANTAAGYEIWRLSSSNLYLKIEYGNGTTAGTMPSLWFTNGTGSNGSGTLTGSPSTRTQVGTTNAAPTSTVTNYQSYLCATANYFGLSWKLGSATTANFPRAFYTCMQTVDSTGAPTSVGYLVAGRTSSFYTQAVATAAGVVGAQIGSNQFFLPGNAGAPANTLDGSGNNQALLCWHNILGTVPMTPVLHLAAVLATDLTIGNTASMTLIGSTAHTYINAGVSIASDASASIPVANLGMAMLWE